MRLTTCSVLSMLVFLACSPPDGRPTWPQLQRVDPPAAAGAFAFRLAAGDAVQLAWLEPTSPRNHRLQLASLDGERWVDLESVVAGDDFFANWADTPGVIATDGGRLAHWLRKTGSGTYDYAVELAWQEAGGGWERRGRLHDDEQPGEHGFVSLVAEGDSVRAFWLDSRGQAAGGDMQLRTTLVRRGTPGPSTQLDERVCECCPTDAAATTAGAIVVYRDRSPDELRDIAFVRALEGGWTSPVLVHADGWQIAGCPVNGPAVASVGERVAVAWFTAASDAPRVLVAFMDLAAGAFESPLVVDDRAPIGRVDLVLDDGGSAWLSWLGRTATGAQVRVCRVGPAGELGPVIAVADTTPERAAGVPRLARDGDRLVVVWIERAEHAVLRAALLPLN